MIFHALNFLLLISAAKAITAPGSFTIATGAPSGGIGANCLPLSPKYAEGQNLIYGAIRKVTFITDTTASVNFTFDSSVMVSVGSDAVMPSLYKNQLTAAGIDLDARLAETDSIEIPLVAEWDQDSVRLTGAGGLPTLLSMLEITDEQIAEYGSILELRLPYMLAGCQILLDINVAFDNDDHFVGDYSLKFNYFCNGTKWNKVSQLVEKLEPFGIALPPIETDDQCTNTSSIIAGLRGDVEPSLPPTQSPTKSPIKAPTEPDSGADSMNASILIVAFACFLLMISM